MATLKSTQPHAAEGAAIHPERATQLGFIFSEIAHTMAMIRRLAADMDGCEEPDTLELMPSMIETLAVHAGALCDIGAVKAEASWLVRMGGAEQWMLPPAYHDAVGREAGHGVVPHD